MIRFYERSTIRSLKRPNERGRRGTVRSSNGQARNPLVVVSRMALLAVTHGMLAMANRAKALLSKREPPTSVRSIRVPLEVLGTLTQTPNETTPPIRVIGMDTMSVKVKVARVLRRARVPLGASLRDTTKASPAALQSRLQNLDRQVIAKSLRRRPMDMQNSNNVLILHRRHNQSHSAPAKRRACRAVDA